MQRALIYLLPLHPHSLTCNWYPLPEWDICHNDEPTSSSLKVYMRVPSWSHTLCRFWQMGKNASLPLWYTDNFAVLKTLCAALCLVVQSCPALCDPMDCSPPGFSVRGDSPGKNTGVGCHAFLQGVFLTQGMNPGLLHCRWIIYCLSYQGSPRILEWVAYSFFRGCSWPRNWTRVFCIAGGFFLLAELPGKCPNPSVLC